MHEHVLIVYFVYFSFQMKSTTLGLGVSSEDPNKPFYVLFQNETMTNVYTYFSYKAEEPHKEVFNVPKACSKNRVATVRADEASNLIPPMPHMMFPTIPREQQQQHVASKEDMEAIHTRIIGMMANKMSL